MVQWSNLRLAVEKESELTVLKYKCLLDSMYAVLKMGGVSSTASERTNGKSSNTMFTIILKAKEPEFSALTHLIISKII